MTLDFIKVSYDNENKIFCYWPRLRLEGLKCIAQFCLEIRRRPTHLWSALMDIIPSKYERFTCLFFPRKQAELGYCPSLRHFPHDLPEKFILSYPLSPFVAFYFYYLRTFSVKRNEELNRIYSVSTFFKESQYSSHKNA